MRTGGGRERADKTDPQCLVPANEFTGVEALLQIHCCRGGFTLASLLHSRSI